MWPFPLININTMNEKVLLGILLIHWIADFILQTHWEATNKSSNNEALTSHTLTYTLFWAIPSAIILGNAVNALIFLVITFMAHTITDYFTSRVVKYFFNKKDFHNGFIVIGLDQILHYLQIYFTLKLLL